MSNSVHGPLLRGYAFSVRTANLRFVLSIKQLQRVCRLLFLQNEIRLAKKEPISTVFLKRYSE